MLKRLVALSIFVSSSAFVSGCASSGTGLDFYSYDQEASQGQQFASQVEQQMKIMKDPFLDHYIKNLGQMMISKGVSDPKFNYTFQVVDSDQVNAFAIPGGHAYVNLALLKAAESEAEVVGVVGHEIGHVIHRHGTKRMTDALLLQGVATGAAYAAGQGNPEKGKLVGMGALLFGQAGLLKYGRNAELEADHSGIEILYGTGYDVQALPRFFQKLIKIENEHGGAPHGLAQLLSTHPPTDERIEKCEAFIATLPPQRNPKINSPEFDEMKKHIASIVPSQTQTK